MAEINITNAKTAWVNPMIYGILLVIVGICMVWFKKDALKWILIITGIMLIIGAIIDILVVVTTKLPLVGIVFPAVMIVIGVVLIVLPSLMADVFMVLLAVVLIIYGVLNVIASFLHKDDGIIAIAFGIAVGILAAAAGIYTLFNLDSTQDIVMIVIGVLTIVIGAVQLIGAAGLYRKYH